MNNGSSPTAAVTSAIDVNHVTKVFSGGASAFTALNDVSISIGSNEFFTLLGPSGCGKTTLLRLIAGFEYPTSGSIFLDGQDIGTYPPYRRPVNTVFQNYALFPHMSVADNIGFGLRMLGKARDEIETRVSEVLALVRMSELKDRATSEISGGQQQRVALARALAPSPRVLLLDEPLSALDFKLRKEMQIELKRMQLETGITFVFVTHDQEEALTMSDRIAVMSAGRVLQVGSPHDIYERPANRFVASFIGETNFLTGTIQKLLDDGNAAVVALDCGSTIIAECSKDVTDHGRCSVIVRPEHLQLDNGSSPSASRYTTQKDADQISQPLSGTVTNIVYSGTDTHIHVELDDNTTIVIRQQNLRVATAGENAPLHRGQAVSIALTPLVARVLNDSATVTSAAGQP